MGRPGRQSCNKFRMSGKGGVNGGAGPAIFQQVQDERKGRESMVVQPQPLGGGLLQDEQGLAVAGPALFGKAAVAFLVSPFRFKHNSFVAPYFIFGRGLPWPGR